LSGRLCILIGYSSSKSLGVTSRPSDEDRSMGNVVKRFGGDAFSAQWTRLGKLGEIGSVPDVVCLDDDDRVS